MSESPSFKIRLLGGLAGCVVGTALGVLIGMAFNKVIFAAVLGGRIGLICGFWFPRVAGFIFGGLFDPF